MEPKMQPASASANLAALSPDAVQKVKQLEARLGDAYVIAYEGADIDAQPLPPANLDSDQVAEVTRAEQALGVCLIAYKKAA